MVSVPLPPHVVPAKVSAVDAVLKSCAAETDTLASVSRPPLIVPLSYTNDPLVTATVSPLPIVSVRDPTVPVSVRIVAPTAFVSVPFVTFKTAPYDDVESVNTIKPSFVKPFSTVRFEVPDAPSPCSRRIAPVAFVTESLNALEPCTSIVPWFRRRVMIVLDRTPSEVPAATVSLPVPPHVEVASVRAVVAVLKSCVAVTDALLIASVPLPPIVPAL